ncbi:MAG: hypothetical protein ACYS1A_10785 [Planctomycetota bacterium]|jgi:hypothetical protein
MKTRYAMMLVLLVSMVVLLGTTAPCEAAEEEERPRREMRGRELTDEMAERILERLAERDPEKAKELKELREKDPEKFKAELRKIMREFRERFGGQRGSRSERQGRFGRDDTRRGGPGGPRGEGRTGRGRSMRERMRERETEHLEWLEKNYPEEAKKLAELKEKNPELYRKQLAISMKKYRRIKEAEKENPKLVKVLKEDLELRAKRNRLVRRIRAAKDDNEKKELAKDLEDVIRSRFDLIVQRKQIAYEQLLEKLEKLKKEVKQSEASIEKWKNTKLKNEKVEARLKELVSGNGKFRWE